VRFGAALAAFVVALTLGSGALADTPPSLVFAPDVTLPRGDPLPPTASVLLEFTVTEDGHATDARVVGSLRDDIDQQVLEAVPALRFTPATREGASVPARIRFRFRLHAAPAEEHPPPPTQPFVLPDNPYPEGENPPAARTPQGVDPVEPSAGVATVTVRGRRNPGAATTVSLRAEELTTVPGTFGEPTRVVATLPGVARSPFGLGVFVVRGASFENTGFFIDGFPVPNLYHFGLGPAVISSRFVSELNFYPGGYPLQYGRFAAGVISLDTRAPPMERPTLEFQVDLLRAGALAALPFDRGRGMLTVAARRSYYELLIPLFIDGVNVSYGDYQVRADYRFTGRSRASVFVFGSYDTFDRTAATGVGETAAENQVGLGYTFHRLLTRYEHDFPEGGLLTVAGTVGWDRSAFVRSDPGQPTTAFAGTGWILGERLTLRQPTGRALTTTVGIDAQAIAYDVNLHIPLPPSIGGIPPPAFSPDILTLSAALTQTGLAAFLEETLRAGPLELTSGVRVDLLNYGEVTTAIADPRAVSRVRLARELFLVGATGFFHQPPPFPQLMPRIGNPALRPTRAWQSSVGVEATLPYLIETRVTGFYNRMYHLQRPSNAVIETPNGTPRREVLADDGEGRAYGLEVMLRRRLERGLYGWVSYTLSRSERFVEGGAVVPFNFDQTHVLNFALSWLINARWRIGARFQLTTGNPQRRIQGAFFDADTDRFRPELVPRDPSGGELERLPTYHQLDLRVDYRFRAGPLRLTAYLDIINAYYAQNSEAYLYQFDYLRRTTFPGLPILPTIGLEGQL
jgi:TonB family protein